MNNRDPPRKSVETLLISPISYQWIAVKSSENTAYSFPGALTDYMKLNYRFPALYRWVITKTDGSIIYYLGETDGLVPRRIYQYLNPGPRQKTNQRLHAVFHQEIEEKSTINLDYLSFSPFAIDNRQITQTSLSDPHMRRFLEELFTVLSQMKGEVLLNK